MNSFPKKSPTAKPSERACSRRGRDDSLTPDVEFVERAEVFDCVEFFRFPVYGQLGDGETGFGSGKQLFLRNGLKASPEFRFNSVRQDG